MSDRGANCRDPLRQQLVAITYLARSPNPALRGVLLVATSVSFLHPIFRRDRDILFSCTQLA